MKSLSRARVKQNLANCVGLCSSKFQMSSGTCFFSLSFSLDEGISLLYSSGMGDT